MTGADLAVFALIPDHWRRIERILVDGDEVAFWLRFGGTLASTARSFEIQICGIAQVRDGKIATWNFYSEQEPLAQAGWEADG